MKLRDEVVKILTAALLIMALSYLAGMSCGLYHLGLSHIDPFVR